MAIGKRSAHQSRWVKANPSLDLNAGSVWRLRRQLRHGDAASSLRAGSLLGTFSKHSLPHRTPRLIAGIDSAELLARINADSKREVRLSDLTQALDRVGRLQSKIGVSPPVLAYSPDARRLFLVDRAFLFYRHYGTAEWPWDRDSLDLSPLGQRETLNLDD